MSLLEDISLTALPNSIKMKKSLHIILIHKEWKKKNLTEMKF